eukprot:NODE_1537_length_821_cov_32.994236_g1489_i0.p1 GENE.NODE_1537_length_821_cov_32.994236_g1489_i0~~NODE_1537_length_821_cov_32.994236_g1489_i0.p1  ORF type:complete len:228 (-),score=56.99 NODE_1537_length_821_cov_32.994236_g1489_i0:45-728(-)
MPDSMPPLPVATSSKDLSEIKASNITWHAGHVTQEERAKLLGQRGMTIWFTGLSASGKSTIATALEQVLLQYGINSYRLDGDNIRFGLNKNLGFSPEDRSENIRRISEVAKLFADSCVIALTSFISPFKADREAARKLHEDANLLFIEVYVDASLDVVKERDPKGLYKKALAGQIPEFTGISSPYEPPENPEIHLNTGKLEIQECVKIIMNYLKEKGIVDEEKTNRK